jgi:hypothetical protein
MAGRHAGERQNEYFVPGEGISREVIQADICRYLGNDALVRPGLHNNRQGYLIRAYRNLTSEMISDLKADSARWEADVARRADSGYPRVTYAASNIHEMRQQGGPSPPPPYTAAPGNYMDPFVPPFPVSQPSGYPTTTYAAPPVPYSTGPSPYVPPQAYGGPPVPPVTGGDMHTYTYANTNAPGYPYDSGTRTAPRYPGPGYDESPSTTTSIPYPATTAAQDTRIPLGGDARYPPAEQYTEHRTQVTRPQQTRERDTHRRTAR